MKFMLNSGRAAVIALLIVSNCGKQSFEEESAPEPRIPKQVYTQDAPAEWHRYAADHSPRIEIYPQKSLDNVHIFVRFNDLTQSHYVEKIGILDQDNKVIMSKDIGRGDGKVAQALFTLSAPETLKGYKAFARCSQHDVWVTSMSESREVK